VLTGEALAAPAVRQLLLEESLPLEAVRDPQAAGAEEPLAEASSRERLRPLGR
jgi:hypothetical protein